MGDDQDVARPQVDRRCFACRPGCPSRSPPSRCGRRSRCCAFGRRTFANVLAVGSSSTQGVEASTRKKSAPVSLTVRSASDRTSTSAGPVGGVGAGGPRACPPSGPRASDPDDRSWPRVTAPSYTPAPVEEARHEFHDHEPAIRRLAARGEQRGGIRALPRPRAHGGGSGAAPGSRRRPGPERESSTSGVEPGSSHGGRPSPWGRAAASWASTSTRACFASPVASGLRSSGGSVTRRASPSRRPRSTWC